jgi:putative ABC transport system substrate-binding protein
MRLKALLQYSNTPTKRVLSLALAAMLFALCASVEAQQATKAPRIGFLSPYSPSADPARIEAFLQGLRELGYIEGRTIAIEWRWAMGKPELLADLVAELVRLKVTLIVAATSPAIQASKNATSTIPIIMAGVADPVGSGFVASLGRPGGNITGMSIMGPDLAGKRLELLKELLPKLSRVAFMAHGGDPSHGLFVKEAQDAAESLGMQFQPLVIGGPEEFERAFSAMRRERAGALTVQPIFVSMGHGQRLADLAARNHVLTVSDLGMFADAGGLMSYGPNIRDIYRRCAIYVDKILKGTKPAELPVEQPTKFELIINLKAAKQIGLTIPPEVLARADRVIK